MHHMTLGMLHIYAVNFMSKWIILVDKRVECMNLCFGTMIINDVRSYLLVAVIDMDEYFLQLGELQSTLSSYNMIWVSHQHFDMFCLQAQLMDMGKLLSSSTKMLMKPSLLHVDELTWCFGGKFSLYAHVSKEG